MNRKVLIIDDDKEFVFLMSRILTKKNQTVLTAYTIEDGMVLLQEKEPDILYLDNQLPDGHGWGKAEYIMNQYPNMQLNLISALEVPKTSTASFRIIEKQLLLEELNNTNF
jgi:two-component system, OmpR family, response regulator